MAHKYMPLSLSLKNRKCLIVGGGDIALRKIEALLNYEPNITVVAPDVHEKIQYFADKGSVTFENRVYESPEVSGYWVVISASDDKEVNEKIYKDCQDANVLVNVVDNPDLCDFIFPSLVRRDCLSITISTDGNAPFLSKHLRLILEDIFPQRWEKIASLAASFRNMVLERLRDDQLKKALSFENFVKADWKSNLEKAKNKELDLDAELERLIEK